MDVTTAEKELRAVKEFRHLAGEVLSKKMYVDLLQNGRDHGNRDYNGNLLPDAEEELQTYIRELEEHRTSWSKDSLYINDIADRYGIGCTYHLSPPPAVGGRSFNINVFQCVLEQSLPFGAEIHPQRVVDVIDSIVGACERALDQARDEQLHPVPVYRRFWSFFVKTFKALFPTDKEQIALRWIVIVAIALGVLKLFGVDVATALKVFFLMLLKKIGLV